MSQIDRDATREYLLRWKRVGPVLAAIRRRELREYDFEKNRELVNDLLEMAAAHAKPRRTSGIAKLQQLLREHYS